MNLTFSIPYFIRLFLYHIFSETESDNMHKIVKSRNREVSKMKRHFSMVSSDQSDRIIVEKIYEALRFGFACPLFNPP